MIVAIYDFFFTRRLWTETERFVIYNVYPRQNIRAAQKVVILLRDQFGNVKKKTITVDD